MGVIVLTLSVCVCYHSNGRTDRYTDLNVGQVEGYLAQGHRSKVKVTRSKNVYMGISMELLLDRGHR